MSELMGSGVDDLIFDPATERYLLLRNLPKHPLFDQGYRSIGCVTCTRGLVVS